MFVKILLVNALLVKARFMNYLFLPAYLLILFAGNVKAQPNNQVIDSTFGSAPALQPAQLSIERPELIDERLVLRGQITDFDFTQPETRIFLDTTLGQWELIAPSAVELRRLGWTSSSLFSGELVEVEAVRLLGVDVTGMTNKASLKRLTRANGALLLTSVSQQKPEGFKHIAAGMYSLETDYSNLEFAYNHMGFSDLGVKFERVNADVLWNRNNPELSIIQLNIDVSSLRSGVATLDDALRGEEFFDSFNYPRIQFKSTQLRLLKWGNLQIDGQLEIRGISQPVQLEAYLNKSAINPMTNETTVGLSVSGVVKRSDWGFSSYQQMIRDEIKISFNGEFVLTAADTPSTSTSTSPSTSPLTSLSTSPLDRPSSSFPGENSAGFKGSNRLNGAYPITIE